MKKVFVISAILLAVILVFLGIYNIAFKKTSSSSAPNVPSAQAPNSNSNKTSSKISAVSDQAVIGPFINGKRQKLVYYAAGDGTVWESNLDGSNKSKIEATVVNGLKSVQWSPDGVSTLSETGSGSGHAYFAYNHASSVGKKLKDGTDVAIWNNEGNGIIYKYFDSATKKRSLNAANPDGSNWKQITDIPLQKISLAPIPQTSLISFWNYPSASQASSLQTVGSLGGEVKTVLSGKYGADYLWAPDGKKAVVSSLLAPGRPEMMLGLVTLDGAYQLLGIPTLASKAVWSKDGKTMYYALAGDIPDNAVMPDDYMQKKFTSTDTFWKVDVETGQKDRIVEPAEIGQNYDATQLLLSPTEDALFFINRIDGKLYRISL